VYDEECEFTGESKVSRLDESINLPLGSTKEELSMDGGDWVWCESWGGFEMRF
jgi:hypothetical protein